MTGSPIRRQIIRSAKLGNAITLDIQTVAQLTENASPADRLLVRRNLDDLVNVGPNWMTKADQWMGGVAYGVFEQNGTVLFIEKDLPPVVVSMTRIGAEHTLDQRSLICLGELREPH